MKTLSKSKMFQIIHSLILIHHEKEFPKSSYSKQSIFLLLLASDKISKGKMLSRFIPNWHKNIQLVVSEYDWGSER